MNDTTTLKKELSEGRTVVSFTKGVSMRPLLSEGKTVVVLKPPSRPFVKGDLPVVPLPGGDYILHRIVKIKNGIVYTRGDNCMHCEKVPCASLIGIVTEIHRGEKVTYVETDKRYRAYVTFWELIFPLRYVYYEIRWIIKKVFGCTGRRTPTDDH